MTVGDAPEMRALFMSDFRPETAKLTYSVHGQGKAVAGRELIVMSRD